MKNPIKIGDAVIAYSNDRNGNAMPPEEGRVAGIFDGLYRVSFKGGFMGLYDAGHIKKKNK